MFCLGKANSVPTATHNCGDCVMSFRVICLLFIILQLINFFLYNFPFQLCINLSGLSHLQQSQVPLQFSTSWYGIATDAMPSHWAFYFQDSGMPLSISGSWSGSMCKAHIALQGLYIVAMMLHRMAFWLSSEVVAMHLNNIIVKAYWCGVTVSAFLSRMACHVLHLTNKHRITLILAHIPTHLNVEADYLSQGQ